MKLSFGANVEITGFSAPISLLNFVSLQVQEEAFGSLPTMRLALRVVKGHKEFKVSNQVTVKVIFQDDINLEATFHPISDHPIYMQESSKDLIWDTYYYDFVLQIDINKRQISTQDKIEEHLKKIGVKTNITTQTKSVFINPNKPNVYHFRDISSLIPVSKTVWGIGIKSLFAYDMDKQQSVSKIAVDTAKSGDYLANNLISIPSPFSYNPQPTKISVNNLAQHNKSLFNGTTPPQYTNGEKSSEFYQAPQSNREYRKVLSSNLISLDVDRTLMSNLNIGDKVSVLYMSDEEDYIALKKTMVITNGGASTSLVLAKAL